MGVKHQGKLTASLPRGVYSATSCPLLSRMLRTAQLAAGCVRAPHCLAACAGISQDAATCERTGAGRGTDTEPICGDFSLQSHTQTRGLQSFLFPPGGSSHGSSFFGLFDFDIFAPLIPTLIQNKSQLGSLPAFPRTRPMYPQ